MQQPTCTNLKVQSLRDALRIFAAVKLGLLRTVSRHLNPLERQALCSGCIYVWEERKLKGSGAEIAGLGIERFTDGRRWSNSQERGVCPLFSICSLRVSIHPKAIFILL